MPSRKYRAPRIQLSLKEKAELKAKIDRMRHRNSDLVIAAMLGISITSLMRISGRRADDLSLAQARERRIKLAIELKGQGLTFAQVKDRLRERGIEMSIASIHGCVKEANGAISA
jgi:uncharacterized membrane protein YadS